MTTESNIQALVDAIRTNSDYIAKRIREGEAAGYCPAVTSNLIATNAGRIHALKILGFEVPDTRSTIATDDDLFEIRDAATMAWTESQSKGCVYGAFGHASSVVKAMLDLGLQCAFDHREGAASPVTIYLADYLGNTAKLDWDPMQDGFDITESPILETSPNADPDCECCGGSGVRIDFFPGSADSGSDSDCECTWGN